MWGRKPKQPSFDDTAIKDLLLEQGLISAEDVAQAEAFRAGHDDTSFVDYFITEGLVTKEVVGKTVAGKLNVPYANVHSSRPARQLVMKVPAQVAQQYRAVVGSETEENIIIVSDDPKQPNMVEEFKKIFPEKPLVVAYGLPEDITDALREYRPSFATRFAEILKESEQVAPAIINEILNDAIARRSSDLHIEPQPEGDALLRLRIDGVLHDTGTIPAEYVEVILNSLKVQARLRIEENNTIQDGAFRFEYNVQTVDIRISVIPTILGESINLHFLSERQPFTLTSLGLSADDREILTRAAARPYGMIMVVGPTGAGKTTTLYSILKIINQADTKIMTIEDPVEYTVPGVTQVQTNPRADLTFTSGLRSILRQDPNTILVGEIRDRETATIAVNAALTGHLLLTTLHAVDAAATIPRLIELGVEPFLLASTLEVVVGQRLVRRTCPACRATIEISRAELKKTIPEIEKIFADEVITTYHGTGCEACGNSGYQGRVAVFEIVSMNQELQNLILSRPSTQRIWELAQKQRRRTMLEDGIEKAQKGLTTIQEVLRVIPIRT